MFQMALAPLLFTRVMSLPAAAREDLLEFIGSATVDETQISALIDEVATRLKPEHPGTSAPTSALHP